MPVWNGLTDLWHPTQILADLQTIKEYFGQVKGLKLAFLGDGRNNVCNSLMRGCAKVGMDMVDVCPPELAPDPALFAAAQDDARRNGCTVSVSHDPINGVKGAHVLYTDVWASMGEESVFNQRLNCSYLPSDNGYGQTNGTRVEDSSSPLPPSLHNHDTDMSRECGALEVTDEVFEAPFSKVFEEAENRMHTIKAMILASLA